MLSRDEQRDDDRVWTTAMDESAKAEEEVEVADDEEGEFVEEGEETRPRCLASMAGFCSAAIQCSKVKFVVSRTYAKHQHCRCWLASAKS